MRGKGRSRQMPSRPLTRPLLQTLPYNQPIPGGLSVGMSVYIQGVPSEHMKR